MKVSIDVSLSSKTVLLVEDQAIIALREKQILEQNGYSVLVVHTGEQAVEAARSRPEISLILMDIDLGHGIDGADAAVQILDWRDIPIVFLSGHTEPEIVERTERITSYGYIVKTSGPTVLLASIKMAFRLYEARTEARTTARMMAVILEVSRRLVSTLDLQKIVQIASDRLSELSGLSSGALYLLDHEHVVVAAATPEIPPDFPEEYRRAPLEAHPHISTAIARQEPVTIADTRKETWTPAEQGIVDARNLASIMYVPLVSQERAIGVYITGATDHTFSIDSQVVDLCVTLANIAAVAIENAATVTAAGTPNPRRR